MTEAAVVALDWGTSSFRLWVMGTDGAVLAEARDNVGMASLKPADYADVLDRHLLQVGVGPVVPVLICGMAGAKQGWHEATYVDLPAALDAIPAHAVRLPRQARDIRILPGLAQRSPDRPDVMRGEETLLLGAVADPAFNGTVCMPGTHSKWIRVRNRHVAGFTTAMTGEVFALLARQSTLVHSMDDPSGDAAANPAFSDAVAESLATPARTLQTLFSVRSIPLLQGDKRRADMPARLSGLLIGLEIAGLRAAVDGPVTLIASGPLAHAYGQALQVAGINSVKHDAEAMARAGLLLAARHIWPERFGSGGPGA